jgi:hypothetical protein
MDRVHYEAIGAIPKPRTAEKRVRERFQDVIMAETPEELREDMRRWVAGIKDDHDRVVDRVKSRIRQEVEATRRAERERQESLTRMLEEEGVTRTQLVPLTGEAGQKFLERVRSRVPGLSRVHDDHGHNSAYDKYIGNNPAVGDLYVNEDGELASRSPVTPDMVNIMRRPEDSSLQQRVENHRPVATFATEGEEE